MPPPSRPGQSVSAIAAVSGFRLLTEPVTMATVISLVCGCLVALVLVVALLLYAFKKEKWCFSREYYLQQRPGEKLEVKVRCTSLGGGRK